MTLIVDKRWQKTAKNDYFAQQQARSIQLNAF